MRFILALAAVVIVGAVAAVAWIYSGFYNVAASSPHTPLVRWAIETTLRQSVRAHAADVRVPPLADSVLVAQGARLFADNCVMCHGAPGTEAKKWSRAMLPAPPELAEEVQGMTSAELFWVIKNGLKMTGMPAWGETHVDGEIWSIVAFLTQLPAMTRQRYEDMLNDQSG